MPVDHATSEVDVRVLDARVHDVNTHTLTSKVAVVVRVVIDTVDAVKAPRSAIVHAQPAGHGLVQVRRAGVAAREGIVALGQRQFRVLEAVNLNRVNGGVLGHERDGLMRAHVYSGP